MSLFTYRHRATVEDCLNHPWIQVSVFIGCAVRMILLHGFEYIPLVATHHISVLLRSWVGRGRLFNGHRLLGCGNIRCTRQQKRKKNTIPALMKLISLITTVLFLKNEVIAVASAFPFSPHNNMFPSTSTVVKCRPEASYYSRTYYLFRHMFGPLTSR